MDTFQEVSMEEVINLFIPKTIGLIRYSSYFHPGVILFGLLEKLKDIKGDVEVVLIDVFDTLVIMDYQARSFNIDTKRILKDVPVLKVSGKAKIGNVVKTIEVSLVYSIDKKKAYKGFKKVIFQVYEEKPVFNVYLGVEKYLGMINHKERLQAIHDIIKYFTASGIDIRHLLFVNSELWNQLKPFVPSYFEELVLFIGDVIGSNRIRIKKTIYPEFKNTDVIYF
ncbi:DUF257 family protein [Thermococcus paralvinellae]|uniref:Uncharacterized protein n=1 Tax=Thermococcus paralvinellae TaxID=582419 RepID=W0I521_9EURY|nr:DUF257 family protein [Thermococcus paralvinellae]AHF81164.1 Hypothetical protein TES1_1789 [Thermococcus paralvinellae]